MKNKEENSKKQRTLDNLEVYQLARKLSKEAWKVYDNLDWQDKKAIGDQFIRSVDSIGANIVHPVRDY